MTFPLWYLIIGALFITMALSGSFLRRLPITTSMLYLAIGLVLGTAAAGFIALHPFEDAAFVERITEIAVIVSLFTCGLKLRIEWRDQRWKIPLRLALGSMVITIALVSIVGMVGLGLSLGAAILLGAILAPTDPVLASDVAVESPTDQDDLRLGLTGEAGLNDGTAFPFVMLGLGLIGAHDLGTFGWRWFSVDLAWAVTGGIAIGILAGTAIGYLVVSMRRIHRAAVGLDEFLTLGLIALAYGGALLAHTYGFLAVFAAGLALRRVERLTTPVSFEEATTRVEQGDDEMAVHDDTAAVHLTSVILGFNERLERIGGLAVVLLIGGLITEIAIPIALIWFAPLLFLVIRPISVWIGLRGSGVPPIQQGYMSWFGIRGIGSIYYLMYAIEHGVPEDDATTLIAVTLGVVTLSIFLHGISVTPLMSIYERIGSSWRR
ncbi:MAG TPA: sodium:proton antiporter [Thermomicrobiales bacterium]|nr:sodium:proton antiporter [Thermomicrobiales bacterium]